MVESDGSPKPDEQLASSGLGDALPQESSSSSVLPLFHGYLVVVNHNDIQVLEFDDVDAMASTYLEYTSIISADCLLMFQGQRLQPKITRTVQVKLTAADGTVIVANSH